MNSLITSPAEGARVRAGQRTTIGGIAWDGGYGISNVEVSSDDGKTWSAATLGPDLGRYAFRTWSFAWTPSGKGKKTVMARATNKIGQTQTSELILNPAGYHHNVIHRLTLERGVRSTHMRMMTIAAFAALIALPAAAQEKPVDLKKAPGLDKVEANCSGCHSLDYILMNSPYPERCALECRSHQDDQGVRRADQRG